jgi:peptide-methionine (R)-S-oxide reductase
MEGGKTLSRALLMRKRDFLKAIALLSTTAGLFTQVFKRKSAMAAPKSSFEVTKTEQEWRKILTPAQFYVLRQHGTERAYSSPLDKQYGKGTYVCAGCALPLFSWKTKFNSGTGWPSFYAPLEGAIATSIDPSFFMTRVEVHCRRCGGHLGHVFDDGPQPTGKRYCMNGVALKFIAA